VRRVARADESLKRRCAAFRRAAVHTNLAGAQVLAGFVADAIKNQGIGLAQYLR